MDDSTQERRVLLPLDGSDLSEFATPFAATLATALRLEVVVAHVLVRIAWRAASSGYMLAPHTYADLMAQERREAEQQAERVRARLGALGVKVRSVVEAGDSPMTLVDIAEREHVALAVMATHGRSGLARVALGGVADDFVRHGNLPTMLIRARGPLPERPPLTRALIPLDGSPLSETALSMAQLLAGAPLQQVTLLRVIDTEERSGASDEARQQLEAARQRIEQATPALHGRLTIALRWGSAADQILEASAEHDLVVMATHGETGATRWAFGSVAEAVLHEARTPLLVARPHTM